MAAASTGGSSSAALNTDQGAGRTTWLPLRLGVDEVMLMHGGRVVRTEIHDGRLRPWRIGNYFKIHDIELDGEPAEVDEDGFTLKRYAPWGRITVTGKPGAPPPPPAPRPPLKFLGDFLRWLGWIDSGPRAGRTAHPRRDRPAGGAAEPATVHVTQQQQVEPTGGGAATTAQGDAPVPGQDLLPWIPGHTMNELLFVHGPWSLRSQAPGCRVDVLDIGRYFGLQNIKLNGVDEPVDHQGFTLKVYPPLSRVVVTGETVPRDDMLPAPKERRPKRE